MTLTQLRTLVKTLYFASTKKTDIDDAQINLLINSFNKLYYQEAAKLVSTIYARDTPDIQTGINGQVDYSGSLIAQNDIPQNAVFNFQNAFWGTPASLTLTPNATLAPDGSQTATMLTDTVTNTFHMLSVNPLPTVFPTGQWTLTIYAKAGTLPFMWIGSNVGGTLAWFNLQAGQLGTVNTGLVASISPVPQAAFPGTPGVTSAPATSVSASGWYKCSLSGNATTGNPNDRFQIGMANADGAFAYAGSGQTIYIWGARRWFTDNMIDPYGIYMPIAVEIKFLGRYIHLDYENIADRYIYNIAFGQVQVLVPSAWTLIGEKVVLLPVVSQSQTMRITYVPHVGELNFDSDQALHGLFPEFHEVIAYEVASTLAGQQALPLLAMRERIRGNWKGYLQQRSRQDGRHIRFVPYE